MIPTGPSIQLRDVLAHEFRPPEVSSEEADLLRACVALPVEADEAWRRCVDRLILKSQRASSDEPVFPPTVRALLPLLVDRRTPSETPLPAGLASRLRAARTIELHRNEALRAIAATVLGHPDVARGRPLLLGGVALADGVWPEPRLRHTSRLDVLLPSARAARQAGMALAEAGLVGAPRRGDWVGAAMRLRHPSGMAVILHGGVYSALVFRLSYDRLMAQAVAGVVNGVEVLRCGPSACFTLTTIAALRHSAGASLLWLADAVFLLRRAADEIADGELASGGPLVARLAARQVVCRAAEIDSALTTDPAVARLANPSLAAATPESLMAALRRLRQAVAAVPGRRARLGWLYRLVPPHLATRLRRRLASGRVTARPPYQGM